MTTRQYFLRSVAELEKIFRTNLHHPQVMGELRDELTFRNAERAKRLLREVEGVLGGIVPVRKPSRPASIEDQMGLTGASDQDYAPVHREVESLIKNEYPFFERRSESTATLWIYLGWMGQLTGVTLRYRVSDSIVELVCSTSHFDESKVRVIAEGFPLTDAQIVHRGQTEIAYCLELPVLNLTSDPALQRDVLRRALSAAARLRGWHNERLAPAVAPPPHK